MQKEEAEQEEKRRFENEYERTRKEALQRIKQAQEKRKAEEQKWAEDLRNQMEELKLREEEVFKSSTAFVNVKNSFACILKNVSLRPLVLKKNKTLCWCSSVSWRRLRRRGEC